MKALKVLVAVIVCAAVCFALSGCGSSGSSESSESSKTSESSESSDLRLVKKLTVQTNSMSPTMEIGDEISIYRVDVKDISVGDIIAYNVKADGKDDIFTHRVIEVIKTENGTAFRTKGDNNEIADEELVAQDDVIGRYEK